MHYSKRCYTKLMQYYLKRKMIEFESEKKYKKNTDLWLKLKKEYKHLKYTFKFLDLFFISVGRPIKRHC